MTYLLPGYEKLANEERGRAAIHKIDRLPLTLAFAAGPVHVIGNGDDARAWAERLHSEPVSMMGVDTEYAYASPAISLRSGKSFEDLRSIRPLVCTVAAWCGAGRPPGGGTGGELIRLLFDLRRADVWPSLQFLFRLHVPWVAHSAKAELHALWACGIEPTEHLLIDTYLTACGLNLGRFHRRQRATTTAEEVAHARRQEEKAAHITSLVGQCEHYHIAYPFTKDAKRIMRERFMALTADAPIDAAMAEYAASDAEFALRLHLAQESDVQRFGLGHHLAAVEWPLVGAVARMEMAGLPADRERMGRDRRTCQEIVAVMARRLEGHDIIPGSRSSFLKAMQSAGVLKEFVRDRKYCTKQDLLRECEARGVHPAVGPFRLHRYFQRLATDDILSGRLLDAEGRQRCSLDQMRSVSGRIASSKPNLVGLDRRLRSVFEAPAGYTLIELDYSQKEVGLAGAEWRYETLIERFNHGDSYAGMAQTFYDGQLTPAERAMSSRDFKKARPDLRSRVKSLALGILYGSGPASIAVKFGCPLAHAQEELRRFFDLFPAARDGADWATRSGLRRGYGLTITGLRRLVEPGNDTFRNALRNNPIQGGAAAIFKTALLRIDGYFRGTATRLLLPRHDSLLILTPVGTEEEVIRVCKVLMIQAVKEKYPQLNPRVDAKMGPTWPSDLTLEEYYQAECGFVLGEG